MRATIIHGAGDLRIEEFALSDLAPDDIRVRIRAGGICGSDLHYYRHGGFGTVRVVNPMVLGHEVAGIVEAVGRDVANVAVGDHVAVNPSLPCQACAYCLAGMPNHCLDMRFYGSAMRNPHVDGAFREQLVCKARQAVIVPKALPLTSAAFAEPLSVCLHAVTVAGSLVGKRVLVSGLGPIGQLAVLAARHAGAQEIIATDLIAEPVALARRTGADRAIDLSHEPDGLKDYAFGKGLVDVVLEASGSSQALISALAVVKPRGTIVQIGLGNDAPLPMGPIVTKEIALRGSFRFHDEFAWAADLLGRGAIDVTPLLSHVLPFAEAHKAFEIAGDRHASMKVQLEF